MKDAPEPHDLRLPLKSVADVLGIPHKTIETWHQRGLLSGMGTPHGWRRTRLYSTAEVCRLAVMRDLTRGPMALGVPLASQIAAFAMRIEPYCVLVIESGRTEDQFACDACQRSRLAEYFRNWMKGGGGSRLEVIDVLLICARTVTAALLLSPDYVRPFEEAGIDPAVIERNARRTAGILAGKIGADDA